MTVGTSAAAANDVFEAYVLSRVLFAAGRAGSRPIVWHDRENKPDGHEAKVAEN